MSACSSLLSEIRRIREYIFPSWRCLNVRAAVGRIEYQLRSHLATLLLRNSLAPAEPASRPFALRPNSADSSILGGTEQNRNGRPEPHYERVALSAELALPSDPSGGFFRSFSYLDPRAECQQRGQWIKTSAGHFAGKQPAMLNRKGLPIGPARRTGTRAATFRDLYEA